MTGAPDCAAGQRRTGPLVPQHLTASGRRPLAWSRIDAATLEVMRVRPGDELGALAAVIARA